MPSERVVETGDLDPADLRLIRALVDGAFGARFDDHDWAHALGGAHFMIVDDDIPLSHASVVPRRFEVAGAGWLDVGYVEAVATQPMSQGQGYGTRVAQLAAAHIADRFLLGALSTSVADFYLRLGWERWRGPTFVETPAGRRRTADDDGGVLVLRTPRTPPALDLDGLIVCDSRLGDCW